VPQLFDPITIRGVEIRNRAWVSPMCQYSAKDGVVGEWHRVHLGSLATGGAGLIMAEATGVVPEGRISIGCPGLYNDEQVAAWATIVDFAHSMGAKMGIQLAHAGRKGGTAIPGSDHLMATPEEGGWEAVAPSAIAFEGYPVPRALTVPEIKALVKEFGHAAKRAISAGFDLLEIQAAHGYLLHEFYSPLSNQRTDEYGGDFEGRTRLLKEVVQEIRASAMEIAAKSGAKIEILTDPEAAAKDASVLYTDVWMSMGDPEGERSAKLKALAPFAVTKNLMDLTAPDSIFMHCLPAHRGEEVSTEVIDGDKSVIWREAYHRRTTIQAILYHLVRGELSGNTY